MKAIKSAIACLFVVFLFSTVSLFSCTSSPISTKNLPVTKTLPPTTTISPTNTISPATTGLPLATESNDPVIGHLDISPLPIPGKNAECLLTIEIKTIWEGLWRNQSSDTLANSKAWITVARAGINESYSKARYFNEVPLEEVIVSGDTSWEGNALENRNITLKCTIQIPKEGIWVFRSYFAGDNWRNPLTFFFNYVATADGIAVKYFPDDELKTSPLAYLDYFDYGRVWPLPVSEEYPLSLELDIPHPPLAGEDVVLTYSAGSPFYDIEGLTIQTEFLKRTENGGILKVPATDIVISSELGWATNVFKQKYWPPWNTNLTVNESKELLTTIKFPEPGEWEISIIGRGQSPNGKYPHSSNDEIKLTITENKAYYGWEDRD